MSQTLKLKPQPGPQLAFHSSPADIVIFGGGAGGGKTWSLLVEPLRHIKTPNFRAGIFRRTRPQIKMDGGMWDEARDLYTPLKPNINQAGLTVDFRWDSRISFNGLQYEHSKRRYDGAQFTLLAFDQLEEFTEDQFWYLATRVRSRTGIRPYTRATCNPEPDSWLAELLDWWIGQDGYIIKKRCGKIRWLVREGEEIIWANNRESLVQRYPDSMPHSLTFILATVYDNQELLAYDPSYISRLKMQHPLVYLRLHGEGTGADNRGGNWKIRAGAGQLFNHDWFRVVDSPPSRAQSTDVIFWDTAATERDADPKNEPSATAYVWLRRHGETYYVMQIGEFYEFTTLEDTLMNNTREIAEDLHNDLHVRWEREPGSAAKRESHRWAKEMRSFSLSARGIISAGSWALSMM